MRISAGGAENEIKWKATVLRITIGQKAWMHSENQEGWINSFK